jgi:outer membrane protein assembly factor BamB
MTTKGKRMVERHGAPRVRARWQDGQRWLLAGLCLLLCRPAAPRPHINRPPRVPVPEPQTRDQFRSQIDAGPKIDAERTALDRLAAQKQWPEWLRRYQRLLNEHPDGFFSGGEQRWVGLARSLRERFRRLPDAVHDRYRREYDSEAAATLRKATDAGDPAAVTRCYLRYRYTSSGPRALAWLAERALDGGDAERAWLTFSRLIAEAGGSEPEMAGWMARAVLAGEISGHPAEAQAVAARLSDRWGDRPLQIQGHATTAREWVKTHRSGAETAAPPADPGERSPTNGAWPNFAGAADGLRGMVGSVSPNVRLAWQEIVPGAGMGLPDYYDGGRPLFGTPYRYPGVARFSHLTFPTLSEGRVYAQAPGEIRCLSLEDGKVIWSARESDLAPQRRFPAPGGFRWWRPQRATQTVAALAGRLVLVRAPAGRYENDSSGWPAEYVLAALDARTGALLWERSAAEGPPHSFYNLPTVAGQTVYTGVSTAMAGLTEYRATALDAATGDRLWTTYLGSGSDPMAGVDGSPAAVRGSTVWVETCFHSLCALDALTGEVQWMAPFQPDTNAPERSGWQDTMNVTNEPVSLIAPIGDRLLFSARWATRVVALNAATGHRAWSADASHSRSLVAVDGSRAILTGDQVRAINPVTGIPLWEWTPPARARVGFPALVGNRVIVPMGASLVLLDAAAGDEIGRISLRQYGAPPGAATVLALGRRLLFAQPDRILALDEIADAATARLPSVATPIR